MKRLFLTLTVAFATLCGFAQEIVKKDATFEDYLSLFNEAGYNVFSYDISSLKDVASVATLTVLEYVKGEEVESKYANEALISTLLKISEFDEDAQRRIKEKGSAYDEENDIYRLATKLKISFTPVFNDSIRQVSFELSGTESIGYFSSWMILRDSRVDKSHSRPDYYLRPFKLDKFEKGKFIPLLMCGSAWWDAECEVYRFCGENELSPDMTSELLKDSPHYFVIGVKFE